MDENRKIYSVAELNRAARFTLENGLGEIWVEGEVSRMTAHANGHWYFTLKDEKAAVACTMFKSDNLAVPFAVRDGLKVRLLGRAGIYETRGTYQLTVRRMEEAGKGSLQEQFEKLKARLAEEGLFDAARKKPLPMLPRKIGVVTSPTGAAIRDIIHVLTRRLPNIEVLLAPVTVQGDGAAASIAKAIGYLNTRTDIDVLIVGRGGGSIEDLWAFNEETVARAISASQIPVISAVGHEIDFTIADFVADVRAPTPSAAAELAVPVKAELEQQIAAQAGRLTRALKSRALVLQSQIPSLRQTMEHALQTALQQRQQRTDEAALRMSHSLQRAVAIQRQHLPGLRQSMIHALQGATSVRRQRLPQLNQALLLHLQQTMAERKQDLRRIEVQLRSLNPLAVLDRGYSLTQKADGTVVRDTAQIRSGELLFTRLAKGAIESEVKTISGIRE